MTLAAASQTVSGYVDSTGKAHPGELMGIGQGPSYYTYSGNEYPFINVVKGSQFDQPVSVGTPDSNGYPDMSSASAQFRLVTHSGDGTGDKWMQTGRWVLRWTGTCDVRWIGGTISEYLPDTFLPNRREYDAVDEFISANSALVIDGPGTISNLELLAPGEEDRYDLGNIVNSLVVADFAGCSIIRTMQWMFTNEWMAMVDSTDFNLASYMTYHNRNSSNSTFFNPDFTRLSQVPIDVQCKMVNEIGGDIYLNVPYQLSNAGIDAFATLVNDNFDFTGGKKAYFELSNECWNGQFEQTDWFNYYDAATHNATFVPATATATETTHGLTTGDEIACFETMAHTDWPYAGGTVLKAIVDDANTFRVTNRAGATVDADITGATKAVNCEITVVGHSYTTGDTLRIDGVGGMTELDGTDDTITVTGPDTFTLDNTDSLLFTTYTSGGVALQDAIDEGSQDPIANVTELRYKKVAESSIDAGTNYGNRAVEMWDRVEAIVTASKMVKVMGSRNHSSNIWLPDVLAATGAREGFDMLAVAPYINTGAGRGAPYEMTNPIFENATPTEITDWMIDVTGATFTSPDIDENIAYIGCTRIMSYECGSHHGPYDEQGWYNDPVAAQAAGTAWWLSTECTRFFTWYWQFLAERGMVDSVHFKHCIPPSSQGVIGMQNNTGDQSPAFLGTKPYWDNGGAPPS